MTGVKVRRHARLVGAAEKMADGVTARRGSAGENPERVIFLTPAQKTTAFRGTCPNCKAPIIAMSEIAVNEPTTVAPVKGDAIRCEACGRFSAVRHVNGRRRMRLELLDPLPSA